MGRLICSFITDELEEKGLSNRIKHTPPVRFSRTLLSDGKPCSGLKRIQVRFNLDSEVKDNDVFTMSSISTFGFER